MDIVICSNCGNSLLIKKNNTITKIVTPNDLLGIYKKDYDENMSYDITFEKNTLEDYLAKKNIKDIEKKKILQVYDSIHNAKKVVSRFILDCSNCGTQYPLKPETVIYSLNFKKQQIIFNDDMIDLKLNDQTLPRTKDYICPNKKCDTNKKGFNAADKEAVIYRATDLYYTKYACTICKTSWMI